MLSSRTSTRTWTRPGCPTPRSRCSAAWTGWTARWDSWASSGPAPPCGPVTAPELQRPVSLAWSGPIDQGVKALADRIGYQVAITAPANPAPIQVAVNMTDVPILDLFEAMGTAAGT
ncbi:MAG: DotD/TraH family lipoprotein, partial [Janthinobacterium lividum]